MPRKRRFHLPGVPAHIVQRGNNRQAVFFGESDYCAYLDWLNAGARRHGCVVHAYVLMTNHVHLLVTPYARDSISRMMQHLGRTYVRYVNRRYRRSGTLWEGRFKSSLVEEESYLLACYRYIELNPVRAGMVERPGEYVWSSFAANALNKPDAVIVPHERYLALARTEEERCSVYRELFASEVDPGHVTAIRRAWQTGTPLGNDRFRNQIESTLGCPVGYSARGRPPKQEG